VQEIKVTIKVKHIKTSSNKIKQHFAILSYSDYFLQDTFLFYRKIKDFLSKFYLDYPVTHVSKGINQYHVEYDVSNIEDIPNFEDIDGTFAFSTADKEERICTTCEYSGEKYCKYHDKKLEEIPEYCFFWSEKG
jgi:hypothetical protein